MNLTSMWQGVVIEIAILAALARMGRPVQYCLVLTGCFLSMMAYLILGKATPVSGDDALMLLIPAVLLSAGGRFLWILIRNPVQALDAVDTYVMEESVANQLASSERGPGAKPGFANWRVAQEIVRKLKGRD